jgi:hypothetical protein
MTTAEHPLFEGDFFQDPYPAWAELREAAPVHCLERPEGRMWLVSRYADVRAALADPRLSRDSRWTLPPEERATADRGFPMMIIMDPPEHTRLRRLVSKVFTTRRMEDLRPGVKRLIDELLAALPATGEVDLMAAYASPLPVLVICELLGVPPEDHEVFASWSNAMVDQVSAAESEAAGMNLYLYFDELIAVKREKPDAGLISALVADADEDRLSHDELIAMSIMLLIAGHETTVNLISSGLLALLTHPAQRERLYEDPDLVPAAVEEFLRWESPIHTGAPFYTTEAVEYSGVTIPAGEQVKLCLAAANRDPARFEDAEELSVDRSAAGHLAFAHGVHHCLGAQLARVEGQEAIRSMLLARPDVQLAVDPARLVYRQSMVARGLTSLPVRLGG